MGLFVVFFSPAGSVVIFSFSLSCRMKLSNFFSILLFAGVVDFADFAGEPKKSSAEMEMRFFPSGLSVSFFFEVSRWVAGLAGEVNLTSGDHAMHKEVNIKQIH